MTMEWKIDGFRHLGYDIEVKDMLIAEALQALSDERKGM